MWRIVLIFIWVHGDSSAARIPASDHRGRLGRLGRLGLHGVRINDHRGLKVVLAV
jgi:hypothetical protein